MTTDPFKDLWPHVRQALSPKNDRLYRKCVVITTEVFGNDDAPTFSLSAKIPRHSENDLGLSVEEETNDRAEAVAFLRKLADKIERS